MFGDDNRAAGRTTESMQYKQPNVRVSRTFQDSNIFGYKDTGSSTITDQASRTNTSSGYTQPRVSKTYQDSNIFGYKDASSNTITDNTKIEMQRPFTAHKKVISRPTEINEVFTRDDRNARLRLRKANDEAFRPNYEKSSPTKRYVNEFYGDHHTSGYDGSLLRPQTATSKSFTMGPKTASDMKWKDQQSNIFSDPMKAELVRESREGDKLMSSVAKWDSKDAFKRSSNLRKSEDLTNTGMKAFAQNKKKMEMNSDIFNTNPKREQRASIDVTAQPQETVKANFADTKNQDLRRSQHMFSDLFNHEDKNYNYKNNQNNQNEPVRPTNLAWNDSRIEKISPRKSEEQTANERKMAHLSSSAESVMNLPDYKSPSNQGAPRLTEKALQKEMRLNMSPQQKKTHEMRSEVPFGESSQAWANRQPEASTCYDFDLNSIPKNMDLDALKKAFTGYHVVDLQADRNNVNGTPIGTGRVQLRASASHDILKLKHELKQQGIQLSSHEESHNKKSNYRDLAKINWHDQYLQHEEGRLGSEFTTPLESKLKNLESEGDIFGNTQGVGKWDRKTLEKVPTTKTDNGGEQKAATDIVKTLNWKNSIKKVATTAKAGAAAAEKEKIKPVRQSTKSSATQPKKTK